MLTDDTHSNSKRISPEEEFVVIAAHELHNPCTSLKLGLQTLKRELERVSTDRTCTACHAEAHKAFFEKADIQVKRAENISLKIISMIEDLLDFGKLQLGYLQVSRRPVDLVPLVGQLIARFDLKRIRLTFDSPSIVGYWDPDRVEQVLVNLISNAIKYGEEKPIDLNISQDSQKDLAKITVKDQGPGIPQELQPKIFQRFERGSPAHMTAGLGLGLYISNQIVAAHGGCLKFETSSTRGTKFLVDLPLGSGILAENKIPIH
jgi:signal transduction histidine kinase